MLKFKLLTTIAVLGSVCIGGAANSSTYLLRLYNVDDNMSAFITNSSFSQELVLSREFGFDYPYVDISPYVRNGMNDILLTLDNGPKGYAYGYDFQIDGQSYASGACGIFNTYGCDADQYGEGQVWSTNIKFSGVGTSVSAVPEPATWALLILGFAGLGTMLRSGRRRPAKLVRTQRA